MNYPLGCPSSGQCRHQLRKELQDKLCTNVKRKVSQRQRGHCCACPGQNQFLRLSVTFHLWQAQLICLAASVLLCAGSPCYCSQKHFLIRPTEAIIIPRHMRCCEISSLIKCGYQQEIGKEWPCFGFFLLCHLYLPITFTCAPTGNRLQKIKLIVYSGNTFIFPKTKVSETENLVPVMWWRYSWAKLASTCVFTACRELSGLASSGQFLCSFNSKQESAKHFS